MMTILRSCRKKRSKIDDGTVNMTTIKRFFEDPGSSFFLFGPRGTGKSTWLRQRFPEISGVRCLPCESYLLQVVPGQPLP